jgi:hypothetical protein
VGERKSGCGPSNAAADDDCMLGRHLRSMTDKERSPSDSGFGTANVEIRGQIIRISEADYFEIRAE